MLIAWALLTRLVFPLPATTPFSGKEFIRDEIRKLGPMSLEEKRVTAVFVSFALLLMTRKERLFSPEVDLYGWSYFLDNILISLNSSPVGFMSDDGRVAIAVAVTLFMIPAGKKLAVD